MYRIIVTTSTKSRTVAEQMATTIRNLYAEVGLEIQVEIEEVAED